MHGVIFVELKKFLDARFGEACWPRLTARTGLAERSYLPVQEYPNAEAEALLTAAVLETGLDSDAFDQNLGEFMAPDLLRMYGSLLPRGSRTLEVVEQADAVMLRVMRARNPAVEGVPLRAERVDAGEVVVTYRSPRRMCGLAKGIVRGVARHFQEPVMIEETSCLHQGADACRIRIRRA
jgi:predicted hydrocarbon binding protein